MLKIEGSAFVSAQRTLASISSIGTHDPKFFVDQKAHIESKLSELDAELEKLNLNLSRKQLRRIQNELNVDPLNYSPDIQAALFDKSLQSLLERIEDELDARLLLYVSDDQVPYVLGEKQISNCDVSNSFPEAMADLGEAMFCFGFKRYTACVFHLMRSMECAVKGIGDKLNVTTIDKHGSDLSWGKIISNVKPAIDGMPKGLERDRWQGIHGLLYSVKEAWRNSTMHPKATYTEEEALEIYEAVRTFIRALAKEIP